MNLQEVLGRAALCAMLACAFLGATAVPSSALLRVLGEISHLDEASLISISYWASATVPQAPFEKLSALDEAETDIVALGPQDRDGVLTWLNHGGRDKLHSLGASDDDIGPCTAYIEPKNCRALQSSNAASAFGGAHATNVNTSQNSSNFTTSYRQISFALGQTTAGNIVLHTGFAFLAGDQSQATYCVSFRNEGQKTASAVTFAYQIAAASGQILTAGSDIRAGPIAPGTDVVGPVSWLEFNSARSQNQDALDNCWTVRPPDFATWPVSPSGQVSTNHPKPAFAGAATLTVSVASVTYDDGSHWP